MFGIGGSEIVIIAVFALLIFGPDKIPDVARQVGRIVADFKRYQASMEAAFRAEMDGGEDADGGTGSATDKPQIPAYATEEDEEDEEEE
ncbi:MAG: twin-arginine translocase TatA/TatE family subunit [Coriobacteriaceae bacterium]|nr:twin-arginine translocase TatA/TatE family subunit [Coriobacteriaceae bacterium]